MDESVNRLPVRNWWQATSTPAGRDAPLSKMLLPDVNPRADSKGHGNDYGNLHGKDYGVITITRLAGYISGGHCMADQRQP